MAQFPDIHEVDSNGQRLARIRMRHRWTQQRLATEAGYSLETIKKYEQGRRSLDRPPVILRLARALDCHPAEITGGPIVPPDADRDGQTAIAAVAAVRRALLRHGRPARPTEAEVADLAMADLRERTEELTRYRQAASLAKTAEALPQLLRALQVAVEVQRGDEQRTAYGLLTSAYECAMQYLYKLGHVSDATLATERVQWAAQETGDPLRVLAARWYDAGEFLNIGEHDEAGAIIDEALTVLTQMRRRTPEAISLRGAYQLKAALNCARSADSTGAERHWKRAMQTADTLGQDRNDWQLQFGPTNAAIWGVSLPVELGQGRVAVDRAEHVQMPAHYSKERQSHHHIDKGRAYFYNGQRERALDEFLAAERLAPQATRMHAGVRETVGTMIRTQKRGQLTELGIRLGVV
ncbi:helix-turn-helix domain-containing protein [Streptomyces chrestomyceticus]|uniref:helix-turn-helix domain-containing protein n=1 Tax=Streptomyces chrestomyceticus TaxID=68185 RepID=UPI00367EA20B